jgi:6-phosphogluconolactonase (cycloisomerase 2 family)
LVTTSLAASLAACGGSVTGPDGDAARPPRFVFVAVGGLGSLDSMGICVAKVTERGRSMQLLPGSPFAAREGLPHDVVIDPAGRFLYAANDEYFRDEAPAIHEIWTFAIDRREGRLARMGPALAVRDRLARMAMGPDGRFLYAVLGNVVGTAIAAFAVDGATGGLAEVPGSPFAVRDWVDDMAIDPQGRFLLLARHSNDEDGIQVFRIAGSGGALVPAGEAPLAEGTLPKRLVFARGGRLVYLTFTNTRQEFDGVAAYSLDGESGALTRQHDLTLRAPSQTIAGEGLALTPAGDFLLVGNNSFVARDITVYRVLPDGRLQAVPGSPFPVWPNEQPFPVSDIAIDPSGDYAVVANFWGALMTVAIDRQTGALTSLKPSLTPLPNQPSRLALLP